MGQIIFPTTLDWSLGERVDVVNVGTYLRLAYLHETPNLSLLDNYVNVGHDGVFYDGKLCWDFTAQSWATIAYNTYATAVIYALWDEGNTIGGGFRVYETKITPTAIAVTRDATSFIGDSVTDTTLLWGSAHFSGDVMSIYVMSPHRADHPGGNVVGPPCYFQVLYSYVVAVANIDREYRLYDDVLYNRFKPTGYWLSPIIDLGPYIHITSLSVTNYSVPTGGSVRIFFRTSGSAPTTGSPTVFEDTSGNTLYYYGPNETWSASDWEEVPSGSEPSYKDRYIQMKLELNGA